jgi:predicted  nucleic acid-binding Zn-ribbon protein
MNAPIKKVYITTVILLLAFMQTTLLAQQSDYQIQQNFVTELNELNQRIDTTDSPADLAQLEIELNELKTRYSEHEELIDAALYPETYQNRISATEEQLSVAIDNTSVIEQLNSRITSLVGEIDAYRSQITDLNENAQSLREQLDLAESNEERQAALLTQYRQNLEERNSFVSDFLQNLMSRYQNVDLGTQQEIADAAERLDDNPVEILRSIILDYINIVDESESLETPDYVAMRAQHEYFQQVWSRIGTNLANTFAPENSSETKTEIDELMAAWLLSVDNQLWESLNNSFSQNGIELEVFTTPDEFYNAIYNYVDNGHITSLERNSEEDFAVYQNFSTFWNETVKAEWGDMLIEGEILTQSQISEIDIKLNDWEEASKPTSNLMFILLIVSVAVIIGLIVLLITKKN